MSLRLAVIYVHGRAPGFAVLAKADAATRCPDLRCVERNPTFFALEPARESGAETVYVEARFPDIVAAYQGWDVPVVTDEDLKQPTKRAQHGQRAREDEGDAVVVFESESEPALPAEPAPPPAHGRPHKRRGGHR